MKRKILYLLTMCFILPCSFILTACGDSHTCSWAMDYSYNDTHHWLACEHQGCTKVANKAEHQLGPDGVCGECNYGYVEPVGDKDDTFTYELTSEGTGYLVLNAHTLTSSNLVIPDTYNNLPVVAIGSSSFDDVKGLNSIVIPDSVVSIGYGAFEDSGLTSITFGENSQLTTINSLAFYQTKITSITIPSKVTYIGYESFGECTELEEINFNATQMPGLTSDAKFDINSSFTRDHNGNSFSKAGYNSEGITVNIGANVKQIPSYLFSLTNEYSPKITRVVFAENSVCETIGKYAFYECLGLESITIPASIKTIGALAFYKCQDLKEININAVEMEDTASNSFRFAGANTSGFTVNIGSAVTKIADDLFYEVKNLTNVVFAQGSVCESIGNSSFYHCDNLKSINLPNSITNIKMAAFRSCYSLTNVALPDSALTLGNYAFEYCYNITSITIPENAVEISNSAFASCYKIKEIYNLSSLSLENNLATNYAVAVHNSLDEESIIKINNGYIFCEDDRVWYLIGYNGNLTNLVLPDKCSIQTGSTTTLYNYEIHSYAFYNRTDITSVIIPDSVIGIGNYAFYSCSNLESVSFRKVNVYGNMTFIGEKAFEKCTSLEQINLPDSVTTIKFNAFNGCAFTSIVLPSSITTINMNSFPNTLNTVYYKGTEADKENISINTTNTALNNATWYYYSESNPAESGNFWHYVSNVPTIWE